MVWNANYPLSSTIGSTSPTQLRANWAALNAWWLVDHAETFSAATSGQHLPGRSGCLAVTTTSGVSSISVPGTGGFAYDTTKGLLEIYREGTAWEGLTDDKYSRVRYGLSAQTIPPTAWTLLASANASTISGTFDTLTEMATATSKVTLSGTGYYWIHGMVQWNVAALTADCRRAIALYKNGSAIVYANDYGQEDGFMDINDIVSLTAADYIQLYAWHNYATTGSADVDVAILQLSRVS